MSMLTTKCRLLPGAFVLALCLRAGAQLPATPRPFPFGTPRPFATPASALSMTPRPLFGAATPNAAPSRDIPLVEKKFEQLSNQKISDDGRKALAINPEKWRHAETDNFIVHYRRVTEAQKVVREVEYDLWYVATALNTTRDKYSRKSHVYVFEDEDEWKKFMEVSSIPTKWAVSYAHGDELFLNIRGGGNSGPGTSFDSHTLAHETTHAVIARIYPGKRFPLWLNEGFAEYMGGASVASRKGISTKHFERDLRNAEMPLDRLMKIDEYPTGETEIRQLYQTSEKFVRFLMTDFPKDRIARFVETVLNGSDPQSAVLEVYADKVKTWPDFMKKYEKFTK